MKGNRDLLQEHPFFGDLPDRDLDLLAGCGVNMRFSAGETIFREGEPADHFYVLRQGRVALRQLRANVGWHRGELVRGDQHDGVIRVDQILELGEHPEV